MSWFKSWFNTKYYHLLYQNRNDDEAHFFIDNFLNHLQLPADAKLLDMGCGKGRHSIYLAQKNFDVTGVDLSEESICEAQKSEKKNLHFFVHDMRKVFAENKFDVVLNLFTSFGYFNSGKENQDVINAFSAALKPNGILVIDFLNAEKIISLLPFHEKKTIEGVEFIIDKKLNNNFIEKKISFADCGKKFNFEERVEALKLADFKNYFSKAGFELKDIFGSYDLKSFDEKTSDRLILIAEKKLINESSINSD